MSETDNAVTAQQKAERPVPSLLDIIVAVSGFVSRHRIPIYIGVILGLVFGNIYIAMVSPTYTAGASLILDMRNVEFSPQKPMVNDIALDSAFVESQVEVVKSKAIGSAVIRKLRLTQKPEFTASTGGYLGDLLQSIGSTNPRTDFELEERALRTLQSRLIAKRIGLSFIIEVAFRSADPQLAADIANEILQAYLDDQKAARIAATQRAIDWLQQSIEGLRQQATTADRAVVEFKMKNNIVNAGGRLINEQQIGEMSSQLVSAAGQKMEAKARLERIESILGGASSDDARVDPAVADSLKSEIITKLRSQYLDLAGREADWTVRYGANHSATTSIRDQMREIKLSMLAELRRIAETYKSDYQIAEEREASISRKLTSVISDSRETNSAQVKMRELESAAQTYRSLYDEFLHRQIATMQQQSLPVIEGRVLSPASRPLSLMGGALGGILFSFLLELRTALMIIRRANTADVSIKTVQAAMRGSPG
jgi:succinoglycan biosynthesis transport protein ExoP